MTFQFRDVVGQAVEVLKENTQDRVQQRLMPSKSSKFQFLVVSFVSLSLILGLQLHPHLRRMSLIKGVLALFTRVKKSARVAASPKCEGAPVRQLMDSGFLWGDHRFHRVGPDV